MTKKKTNPKDFSIKVVWNMSADIQVSANNIEEAKQSAIDIVAKYVHEKQGGSIPELPTSRLQPDSIYCYEANCFSSIDELIQLQNFWKTEDGNL